MHNWSVDTKKLQKYPKQYKIWKLEGLINFGLGKEKIKKVELVRYFKHLRIDPPKKKYLKFLLFGK